MKNYSLSEARGICDSLGVTLPSGFRVGESLDYFINKELTIAGAKKLVGKSAQSTVLTMISNCGQRKIPEPAQKITGYEVIDSVGKPYLLLTLGGESVLESTLFNIH